MNQIDVIAGFPCVYINTGSGSFTQVQINVKMHKEWDVYMNSDQLAYIYIVFFLKHRENSIDDKLCIEFKQDMW